MPRFDFAEFMETGGKFAYEILAAESKHKKELDKIKQEIETESEKQRKIAEEAEKRATINAVSSMYPHLDAIGRVMVEESLGMTPYPMAEALTPTETAGEMPAAGLEMPVAGEVAPTTPAPVTTKAPTRRERRVKQIEKGITAEREAKGAPSLLDTARIAKITSELQKISAGIDLTEAKTVNEQLKAAWGGLELGDVILGLAISGRMKEVGQLIDTIMKQAEVFKKGPAKTEVKHKVGGTIKIKGKSYKIIRIDPDGTPVVRKGKKEFRAVTK